MANGAAVFDIFSLSEKFEKVGFPKDQAKVIIEAIASSRSHPEAVSHAELEVKTVKIEANVKESESKVLQAISELRKDNEILRSDITWIKWILGVLATGIFVPLFKGMFQ